eukprot:TRINITY_DN10594_c0_g2_i1.p1 TRINITY_DN10594_c0_g2~~TRINITY_DN10594_c0_g2_i1.p1  ORF type:complete len:313 (+),score=52.60 TRINITY_DN10594_c0_g2_i1:705-1643(+)
MRLSALDAGVLQEHRETRLPACRLTALVAPESSTLALPNSHSRKSEWTQPLLLHMVKYNPITFLWTRSSTQSEDKEFVAALSMEHHSFNGAFVQTRLLRQADVARQVRLKLQCSGFQSYRALKDAFIAADADCDGELSREELRQLFEQQRVWLEDDQVEAAFAVCDGDHDGKVKYEDLLRVLDWRQPLPDEEDINEVARRMEVTDEQRVFGLPSIRTDRPPPRRKAVDDMTNYGDLTTTKTLVTPDAFTLSGVDPSEMDRPRSMKEAVRLLQALDQTLSEDLIRQVYQQLEDKSITTSVIQLSKALALSQTM